MLKCGLLFNCSLSVKRKSLGAAWALLHVPEIRCDMANKSNEKKIQPIVIEDIDRVCDIWLIGSLTSNGFIHAGFWYSLLPKIKMQFSDISRTWVYKENGIIKGFVTLGTEDGTGSNYIEELFVDLPYQRKGTDKEKGIGTQL